MSLPPSITPAPRRIRRKRRIAETPPAALVLTAATYQTATSVRLTFDRAIDISALDPSAIGVFDGAGTGKQWGGTSGTLIDPQTVQIELWMIGRAFGSAVFMNADVSNGIVASDDGGAWSGADGLTLPFP